MVLLKANKYTPRWIVFLLDLFVCFMAILVAYMVRFNFEISVYWNSLNLIIPFVLLIRAITFVIFKTYAGVVRFTSAKDTERVVLVVTTGSAVFALANFLNYQLGTGRYIIPFSVVIIDMLAASFLMVASRLVIKKIYHELINPSRLRKNVIIFGADEAGAITKRTIDRDAGLKKKVIAFIDTDKSRIGKKLEDIKIYPPEELAQLLKRFVVSDLIISKRDLSLQLKDEIIQTCFENDVAIQRIPDSTRWINGDLSYNQIQNIKIDDLLERAPISLDNKAIRQEVIDNVVIVTGAAGSIGSGIVRELVKYHPRKIILFDQAESPLYDIELEVLEKLHFRNIVVELGDITDYERLKKLFIDHRPAIVYHAAAYKHVPMMESNPSEAITTNVQGTKYLADLSHHYKVDKFVMISTDKAVNPTNIMGASKRIAELYIQSLNYESETSFVTTRFGNVLGSNGSVIPRFKKQIEAGGPVTITHPDVTRFFMTIPEACQLVLEASAMGNGGEIYLFDMGKSVKISDLAQRMIKISGLTLGKDIQIIYNGLRPGEKLHEELLTSKENTIETHHEKILKASVQFYEYAIVNKKIHQLIDLMASNDKFTIVKLMKDLVPEFKSKNSVFERLDLADNKDL